MKLTGKLLLSTLILAIATMLAGAVVSALPLSPPVSLPGTSPSLPSMLLGSLVLVIGVVPIASGLGGRFAGAQTPACIQRRAFSRHAEC